MASPKLSSSIVVEAPRIDGTADLQSPSGEAAAAIGAPDQAAGQGARALHAALHRALVEPHPVEEAPAAAPQPAPAEQKPGFWSLSVRRSLKIGVALGLLAVFGVRPLQAILQAASVEAVVNVRVATIRSPIDGEVVAAPRDFSAWSVTKGAPVLKIANPDADPSRLSELRRGAARIEDEQASLKVRLSRARAMLTDLDAQTAKFIAGRTQQLEARIAALQSDRQGAVARAEEAQAAYDRVMSLNGRGISTNADLARATRDRVMTAEAVRAAQRRIDEATVELTAARAGSFLGDSYNDRPSSAQRADDLRLRIDELTAEFASKDSQRARYAADVAAEEVRYARLSESEVTLPVSGRVWEIMVAPGERVRRDQDLMRIADCSHAVVTASVEEAVYNQLRVGGPARFRPSEGGQDIQGVIVNLTGISAVGGNLAIPPNGLSKQSYHVTVSAPAIADSGNCTIGRTGRVYFDKAGDGAEVASAPLPFGLRR